MARVRKPAERAASLGFHVPRLIRTGQLAIDHVRVERSEIDETGEYPTLIDEAGLSVLPISSLGLTYPVSTARISISTGIPRLDAMLGGKGYYQGSSTLLSNTAGTGKTSLAAAFLDRVCRQGGKVLYCAFEESPDHVNRKMRSIGMDLDKWRQAGRLQFHTNLTGGGHDLDQSEVGISSLMDTWLQVRVLEANGERNRLLYVLKSRGMVHSNQLLEFLLPTRGSSSGMSTSAPGRSSPARPAWCRKRNTKPTAWPSSRRPPSGSRTSRKSRHFWRRRPPSFWPESAASSRHGRRPRRKREAGGTPRAPAGGTWPAFARRTEGKRGRPW